MSNAPSGRYVIVNRVLSSTGQKLAITFNGQNETLTVTPLTTSKENQVWVLKGFDNGTSSVSPDGNSLLLAAWGSNGTITILRAGSYVWVIKDTDAGYTIQDGGESAQWGVSEARADAEVTINKENGLLQNWILEAA